MTRADMAVPGAQLGHMRTNTSEHQPLLADRTSTEFPCSGCKASNDLLRSTRKIVCKAGVRGSISLVSLLGLAATRRRVRQPVPSIVRAVRRSRCGPTTCPAGPVRTPPTAGGCGVRRALRPHQRPAASARSASSGRPGRPGRSAPHRPAAVPAAAASPRWRRVRAPLRRGRVAARVPSHDPGGRSATRARLRGGRAAGEHERHLRARLVPSRDRRVGGQRGPQRGRADPRDAAEGPGDPGLGREERRRCQRGERRQDPGAHRQRRGPLGHPEHVQEPGRPAQVVDQRAGTESAPPTDAARPRGPGPGGRWPLPAARAPQKHRPVRR